MKIVIDIEEKRFRDIQRISTVQLKGRTPTLEQVIAHGTPLPKGHCDVFDKIRAEITALDDADYDYEGYYKAVTDAVKIIDKYKAGSEDV